MGPEPDDYISELEAYKRQNKILKVTAVSMGLTLLLIFGAVFSAVIFLLAVCM